MHEQCIKDDALRKTFARLGRDKPHVNPESKDGKETDEAKRPLSPTETGAAVSAHSIDVKADGESDSVQVGTKDSVDVKQSEDEDAPGAPEDSIVEPSVEPPSKSESQTPTKATSIKLTNKGKAGRPRKKGEANGDSAKPWEGLFEVTLKMAADRNDAMTLEFKDLREGIKGGEKTWTEKVHCLVCGAEVN